MKQKHWWGLGGFLAGTFVGHTVLRALRLGR